MVIESATFHTVHEAIADKSKQEDIHKYHDYDRKVLGSSTGKFVIYEGVHWN